jgi:hypothetical protein
MRAVDSAPTNSMVSDFAPSAMKHAGHAASSLEATICGTTRKTLHRHPRAKRTCRQIRLRNVSGTTSERGTAGAAHLPLRPVEYRTEAATGHHLRVTRSDVIAGLGNRCPNCGNPSLFPPRSLRIREVCQVCELKIDPGGGFWLDRG